MLFGTPPNPLFDKEGEQFFLLFCKEKGRGRVRNLAPIKEILLKIRNYCYSSKKGFKASLSAFCKSS
jgi:hypothetical protein